MTPDCTFREDKDQRWSLGLLQFCVEIACTVKNPHDFDCAGILSVEDHVIRDPFSHRKRRLDLPNEPGCNFAIGLLDHVHPRQHVVVDVFTKQEVFAVRIPKYLPAMEVGHARISGNLVRPLRPHR